MYYLVTQGGLGIDKGIASGIMGAYGGAVYLFTIIGAWIADRLLGADRTLFGSAVVVMLGHIGLALIPGVTGVGVGLVLIALGSGGLKATATTIVGGLYSRDDPRRDAGFSLYYLGREPRRLLRPAAHGAAPELPRLPLRLRPRRRRHGGRTRAVRDPSPEAAESVRHVANPVDRRRLPLIGVGVVVALVVIVVAVLTGLLTVGNLPTVVVAIVVLAPSATSWSS